MKDVGEQRVSLSSPLAIYSGLFRIEIGLVMNAVSMLEIGQGFASLGNRTLDS